MVNLIMNVIRKKIELTRESRLTYINVENTMEEEQEYSLK